MFQVEAMIKQPDVFDYSLLRALREMRGRRQGVALGYGNRFRLASPTVLIEND